MAKNTAVAACDWVVDAAVQLHGGAGYMRESEVERHYRDTRIMGIGGGTTEIMNEIIAKGLLDADCPSTRARPVYVENRAAMLDRLGELDAAVAKACAGGGETVLSRHHARGKLLARERIELLVDRDSPFLELMPVAAYGSDFPVGAGVVTGIGIVVRAPVHDRGQRSDRPRRRGQSVHAEEDPAGRGHRDGQPAADGEPGRVGRGRPADPGRDRHPRWTVVPGPDPAVGRADSDRGGGLRQRHRRRGLRAGDVGLYDLRGQDRAKVFLGGPPLVKMATGEESDDETLGGAVMHGTRSGLADYVATDEQDGMRLARPMLARVGGAAAIAPAHPDPEDPPPRYDLEELLGWSAPICGCPTTRERCWPGSSTAPSSMSSSLVTARPW